MSSPIAVYLEVGSRRVFACSLDWPGWCRSGKDEERALQALSAAAPRYQVVAEKAGLPFAPPTGESFQVVQRIPGSATTDFGAPDKVAESDSQPLTAQEAERQTALVAASWTVFDEVAAVTPAQLRKGPRGGGRDRDAIVDHVLGTEAAYARKLSVRLGQPQRAEADAIRELRNAIVDVLGRPSAGQPLVPKGWPPRYAARRIAWHVLDHAWEMQDRS